MTVDPQGEEAEFLWAPSVEGSCRFSCAAEGSLYHFSRYPSDLKGFGLVDNSTVRVEEAIHGTGGAATCSCMNLLSGSLHDGIYVFRVTGHMPRFPPYEVSLSLHTPMSGVPS